MPSIERVRFVSSGTEAAMSAVRVARAATGRDRILKFEGCYHGHADAFLVKAGSGALTLGDADQPRRHARAASADTLVAGYNDLDVGAAAVRRQSRPDRRASSSSRLPATWASCRRLTAFCAALREICTGRRRAADLRRGDLRVSRRGRRRAGAARRAPRSDLPRQDHRRRPAGRRLRRARGPDGSRRRRPVRSIRPARCRAIRWR